MFRDSRDTVRCLKPTLRFRGQGKKNVITIIMRHSHGKYVESLSCFIEISSQQIRIGVGLSLGIVNYFFVRIVRDAAFLIFAILISIVPLSHIFILCYKLKFHIKGVLCCLPKIPLSSNTVIVHILNVF